LACIAERNSWTLNPDPAGNPNCVRSICPDCSAWLNRSSCDWNCGVRRSSSRFCVALCSSGRNCDRERKGQTSCISRCMDNRGLPPLMDKQSPASVKQCVRI
jgi:hypothetical protein